MVTKLQTMTKRELLKESQRGSAGQRRPGRSLSTMQGLQRQGACPVHTKQPPMTVQAARSVCMEPPGAVRHITPKSHAATLCTSLPLLCPEEQPPDKCSVDETHCCLLIQHFLVKNFCVKHGADLLSLLLLSKMAEGSPVDAKIRG